MRHSVRLSKIKKREIPVGMRKIVVRGRVYFYRIHIQGEGLTILTQNRKPFHSVWYGHDCTWRPSDVVDVILRKLNQPTI